MTGMVDILWHIVEIIAKKFKWKSQDPKSIVFERFFWSNLLVVGLKFLSYKTCRYIYTIGRFTENINKLHLYIFQCKNNTILPNTIGRLTEIRMID